jgi:hypothetical protein
MVAVYKDMSEFDSSRISEAVDSIAQVFDEDHSGTVGKEDLFCRYFI